MSTLFRRGGDPVARRRYRLLALVVLAVGVAGVVLAAAWPCAAVQGGRGGAVGVVIALGVIWMKPDFHLTLLQKVREREARRTAALASGAAPPDGVPAPPPSDENPELGVEALRKHVLAKAREREALRRAASAATPVSAGSTVPRPALGGHHDLPSLGVLELTKRVISLDTAIVLAAEYEEQSVFWLALSTTIATFFWGFGDLLAGWLRLAWAGAEACH